MVEALLLPVHLRLHTQPDLHSCTERLVQRIFHRGGGPGGGFFYSIYILTDHPSPISQEKDPYRKDITMDSQIVPPNYGK